MNMEIIPIEISTASMFVQQFHRHSGRVRGSKFAIGLMREDEMVGVAIAGRPLARMLDDGLTIEIRRVCVKEGVKNGSSMLYGRMRRICQTMGYKKIITYTLLSETGSSLKAVNAKIVGETKPGSWSRKGRQRIDKKITKEPKYRWEL